MKCSLDILNAKLFWIILNFINTSFRSSVKVAAKTPFC